MESHKTIAVVGGTGRVGGSVALSLLGNPKYRVRVTTRDASSAKSEHLRSLGAEVVKADSWNPAELDKAMEGAWGVFLNTNGEAEDFAGNSSLRETQMGKNVIDAARRQGVEVFVYAGLPEAEKVTNGNVQISTFFHKNNISAYARQTGFRSTVNVNVGWKMENFWDPVYEKPFGGFARVEDAEGYLTINLFPMGNPPKPTPFTSIRDDYGDIVHGVFIDPDAWNGQTVWAVSDPLTFQEFADTYNRVSGTTKARFVPRTEPTDAATPEKAVEVNAIRRYVEYVNGYWCDGKPIDQTAARQLKKAGAVARKAPENQQRLKTVEGFISQYAFKGEDM